MIARVKTVAFRGVEAIPIDVEVMIAPGKIGMHIVGLPDKAVAESRERVQAALHASGLSMPAKKITINLAPADLPKEGSHYDLPIALGLMASLSVIPSDALDGYFVLGELSLDGTIMPVSGSLPAAMTANSYHAGLICPAASGSEAAWAGSEIEILAPSSLIAIAHHFRGLQILSSPQPVLYERNSSLLDFSDIKGQETAKRALEVCAAGGHNLLMCGPPGAGKSMLAERLSSILPPLTPSEFLEVSMIKSVAGSLSQGKLTNQRPFRAPHHSASMAAMIGGGAKARPGEVSLAHHGVLFLDEFPEFSPQVLDSLRQPLESGACVIARANHHITYPARIQLIAAMNPCRCGLAGEPGHQCLRGPRCKTDYQARISGPLLDRIDIKIEVPPLLASELISAEKSETSLSIAQRVAQARDRQKERFLSLGVEATTNAQCSSALIKQISKPDSDGLALLHEVSKKFNFSARAYDRILRVSRTLADLDTSDSIQKIHLAEAISWRFSSANMRYSV